MTVAKHTTNDADVWNAFNTWVIEQSSRPLRDLEFIHEGALNLYLYPEIADYAKARPMGRRWRRLDSPSGRPTRCPSNWPTRRTVS
ncbi:hypothetical protein [Streptomyces sp. NBC_01594]|uniref:hypothetical protein n=1 Tax=Streptomyces sp. NBC_01594 TaxID=2975890 RepID=UPI0038690EF3